MTIREITAPSVEPVSLAEANLHLREDGTDQDTLIQALIKGARQYAEAYTGRAFVARTFELTLPAFPAGGEIEVPRPPLIAVESVKYIDTAGALQTVAAADYQVDTYRAPGLVKPAYGATWPATRSGDYNAVQVRFQAGYAEIGSPSGEDPANGVPELVRQWILVRVAQLYEHREAVVTGTMLTAMPRDFVDGLLDQLKVHLFE
jgi:uncharacterized phiE125 gp8 family phage protein